MLGHHLGLEAEGFEVCLVDGPGEDIDLATAIERGRDFKPHLVVVATTTPSIYNDIAAATALKEATGAYTVLVGTHTTAEPDATLDAAPLVDAVTRSEYDWTILELARHIEGGGGEPVGIQGLTYRREGDERVVNADRPDQADISGLPHVARIYKKFFGDHWKRYFYAITRHPVVTIITVTAVLVGTS